MTKQQDLLKALLKFRRNALLLLFSLGAGVGGAQAVTMTTPATYEARSSVLVTSAPTIFQKLVLPGNAQVLMPTIARLAESRAVAVATARVIGLPPAEVIGRISADSAEGVQILTLTARAGTPDQAVAIANGAVHAVESQAQRTRLGGGDSVRVSPLDTATVPTGPASPKPFLNGLVGALLGLLAGVALARLRDLTDDKIRSVEELTEVTGAPVLASVPLGRMVRRKPLITQQPTDHWSDAFGHLRTNLEFTDVDSPPRLVAVTSALPSEGKSIVACNLALSTARAGRRVLLIDADLRRSRCHEYLGLAGTAGLTTVLAGQSALGDVTQQCGDAGDVTFLAAGALPPNPGEMLASHKFQALLRGLRELYDLVVMDLPPTTFADAAVVAGRADGTIVVTQCRATRARHLRRATQTLTNVNARILGYVLNMTTSDANSYYRNRYAPGGAIPAQSMLTAPSTSPERGTQ